MRVLFDELMRRPLAPYLTGDEWTLPMMSESDLWRRDRFDSVAETYDRARPSYPQGLIDDLIGLADIREGSRVLEIGPGTGQLSVPLAERGASLVAIERGPNLAEVVRRKLSRFDHADVVVADFERWEPSSALFDVVVAATAFHWLAPSTRVAQCAALLRPGGFLAVVNTRWGVAHGDDSFFVASQACYARWDSKHDPSFRQARSDELPSPCLDLATRAFARVVHRRYLCAREHSAATYCSLVSTFSDVLALEEGCRAGLLACMSRLIDSQFGGTIVRHDLYDLCIAERGE